MLQAIVGALLAACGGGQTAGMAFDAGWSDDGGAGIGAFQQHFAGTPIPAGVDAAIGVAGGKTVIGVPLGGGSPWTFDHALDSRPVLVGTVVVGLGGGELFALDARTGRSLWTRRAGGRLRGAGDDGRTTVVSLQPTTGLGSSVLAVTHDGLVVRQIEDDAEIGTPAVIDGFVFFPWKEQYVTVYDLQLGQETARVLLRSQTTRAFTAGGTLYFGERTVTRFDDRIRLGSRGEASTVTLPAGELPGPPRWMPPGGDPLPLAATARDKAALYARPASEGPAGVSGGRFAATYYRIAVGLDANDGAVAWAHAHGSAFLGGAAYEGGFALCDEQGTVTFLDGATGNVAGEVSLGREVDACAVQADAFVKTSDVPAASLAKQLTEVVRMPEVEHASLQRLLLKRMAALPDEGVTATLIELVTSERTPPFLLEDARAALASRRSGADAMLAALGRRYDFLTEVLRPPPVGPLADALSAMGAARAAPLLAMHLGEPADTPDDVSRAASALAAIGTREELPALRAFFAHYRCAAEDEVMASAVVSAARALVRLESKGEVAFAQRDPLTSPLVRPGLEALATGGGAAAP